jgi:hypothetical protein
MRCVLLPAPEGGQAPLELELLPPRTLPEEVLQQVITGQDQLLDNVTGALVKQWEILG